MKMNKGYVVIVGLLSVSSIVCDWRWSWQQPKTQEEVEQQYMQGQEELQYKTRVEDIKSKQTEVKQEADIKTKKQTLKAEQDKKKADLKAEADKKRIERKEKKDQQKLEKSKKQEELKQKKSTQESRLYQ